MVYCLRALFGNLAAVSLHMRGCPDALTAATVADAAGPRSSAASHVTVEDATPADDSCQPAAAPGGFLALDTLLSGVLVADAPHGWLHNAARHPSPCSMARTCTAWLRSIAQRCAASVEPLRIVGLL
jgi:hypothetical protein